MLQIILKLTVYPKAQHDSWTETYNNDGLYAWFLEHKKFRFEAGEIKIAPEKYTGTFLSGNDTANIFQVAGELRIRYGSQGSEEAVMKPAGGNTFYIREDDLTEISFKDEVFGEINSFILYNNSRKVFSRVKSKDS